MGACTELFLDAVTLSIFSMILEKVYFIILEYFGNLFLDDIYTNIV